MKYDDYKYYIIDVDTGEVIEKYNKNYKTYQIRKEVEIWTDKAKGCVKRRRLITYRLVKKLPEQLKLFEE